MLLGKMTFRLGKALFFDAGLQKQSQLLRRRAAAPYADGRDGSRDGPDAPYSVCGA